MLVLREGGAPVILYCRLRQTGYGTPGDVPVVCPACRRETKWTTAPRSIADASALTLTAEDRRFLRSLRIDPE